MDLPDVGKVQPGPVGQAKPAILFVLLFAHPPWPDASAGSVTSRGASPRVPLQPALRSRPVIKTSYGGSPPAHGGATRPAGRRTDVSTSTSGRTRVPYHQAAGWSIPDVSRRGSCGLRQ
jgi:hypothetical protein